MKNIRPRKKNTEKSTFSSRTTKKTLNEDKWGVGAAVGRKKVKCVKFRFFFLICLLKDKNLFSHKILG